MPTVSNTSPLIWLSKIGALDLLKDLFGEVLVPEEVYGEAVERGLREGYSDALIIKESFDQGWIKVSNLGGKESDLCRKMMKHAYEIHLGEVQVIVLARKMGANTLLLMDESSGRAFAEAWGLRVKGVLYVIVAALQRKLIDEAEAKEKLLALVRKGFRIDPNLLARVIREIETSQGK